MAAYAALVSLMNLIHDIQHHPSPPISLDKDLLDSITQCITFLHNFLHAYSPPPVDDDETADPLEMRIANAAYAAEDAIESHIVDIIQLQRSTTTSNDAAYGLKNQNVENIRSINLQPCHDSLQHVIEEMDSIKKVVAEKVDTEDNNNNKEMAPLIQDLGATNNVIPSNQTMVGFNKEKLQIMEKLAGGEPKLQSIPILGMGGIGKTFLAKSIYAAPIIEEYFNIIAWATISQQYNSREIFCEILSQATKINKEQLSGKSEDVLGSELHKYLFGRRFLIVLDDMWSIDAWDRIQRFFPNNRNGSRILVTTRLSQLGFQLNNNYNLHLSFLDEVSSWELFSKTVFGDKSPCPHELKEIGEKIVKHCRGLPLSIIVVGGILKKMDADPASWKSIQDNLSSVVSMENDKHCFRLLKMSYNQLPVYLKPCFLYMGVFKEDDDIRVGPLLKQWVSEGFLKPTNDETLETTARGFLQDLIDRNLIIVDELGSTGSIKWCKIHDLVRDMCLKEAQKEGLYHVIGQGVVNTQRRVVIPENTSKEKVCDVLRSMSHCRSVICQTGTNGLRFDFEDMRLLRTLHYLPYYYEGRWRDFFDEINGHVNLRHLTIDVPSMSELQFPSIISHIWNLHTLKVKVDSGRRLSSSFSDLWEMSQFRHIEFGVFSVQLLDPPCEGRVIVMENLHTLKGVRNFKFCQRVIERIPNIKKMKLYYDAVEKDEEYFEENIESLCRLESLYVAVSKKYGYLQHNKLTFPDSLKKLCLFHMEWEECSLERIGSLPLLEKLTLFGGRFRKGDWETVEGQFPSLKYLKLESCDGLKSWTAAEESSYILPRLEQLYLFSMDELKMIPCEVGNIDTLRIIQLIDCGEEELVKCVKEMVEEQIESQGEEQLCFHVEVRLWREDHGHLMSLAGPNFKVSLVGVPLQIMDMLAGGQLDRQVLPIVGMGGIGKTFLAESIYTRPFIKEHFDMCAWATISQQYNAREILREILSQASNVKKKQLSGESEDALGSMLHKYLFGRRFLIVLDDMWSIDAWDKIQRYFPNNQKGSRILVTTRLSQLGYQLNHDYNHRMSFLDESSSWDLFSKTVFGDNSLCPDELKEIGEKIVKQCRGLPLSITVVGGLLKKMDADPTYWKSVQDNLSSVVNMENDKHCFEIVEDEP